MTKRDSFLVFLVLLGLSSLTYAGEITINALRATPRWGNNACWVDTGARLKNTCTTTQLLSFMPEQTLMGKTVTSSVLTDAPFAKLRCQHVSLEEKLTNYWTLGPFQWNSGANFGVSAVQLAPWWVPHLFYQIDCEVPPGVQVMGAHIIW